VLSKPVARQKERVQQCRVLNRAKIRPVEQVESLRTELELQPLMQWELLAQRQVGLPEIEAAKKVTRFISLLSGGGT